MIQPDQTRPFPDDPDRDSTRPETTLLDHRTLRLDLLVMEVMMVILVMLSPLVIALLAMLLLLVMLVMVVMRMMRLTQER